MSRLIVQVVLRDSTSISPDCSAVKRSLALSGVNFDLGGVAEDGGGDGAAEIDVEAEPVALVVRRREAGQTGAHAALQEALGLHVVQRRSRSRRSSQPQCRRAKHYR